MQRRKFIKKGLLGASLILAGCNMKEFVKETKEWKSGEAIMPVLFVGHGAPTLTLDDNKYNRAWRKIAQGLPKPKAIVCISAHWLTRGTQVTAMKAPKTIHDFGRMDDRLFDIQYNAPGSPELANQISQKLMEFHVEEDHRWGLDHGCWCVARCMYPEADIPILQLSIDYYKGGQYLYDLGKELSFLREKGVLILCSGNIVHNLRRAKFSENTTYDWSIEFDTLSKDLIMKGDHQSLINYQKLGTAAQMSIPTPDHYYPLLYALSLQRNTDKVSFPIDGIAHGSISMTSVLLSS
jgi:4,5-DOPA dioxygenase extradiol